LWADADRGGESGGIGGLMIKLNINVHTLFYWKVGSNYIELYIFCEQMMCAGSFF